VSGQRSKDSKDQRIQPLSSKRLGSICCEHLWKGDGLRHRRKQYLLEKRIPRYRYSARQCNWRTSRSRTSESRYLSPGTALEWYTSELDDLHLAGPKFSKMASNSGQKPWFNALRTHRQLPCCSRPLLVSRLYPPHLQRLVCHLDLGWQWMTMLIEVFPDGALLVQGFVSWSMWWRTHLRA